MRAVRHIEPAAPLDDADVGALRSAYSGVSNAVLVCDGDGRMRATNAAGLALWGDIVGGSVRAALPGLDLSRPLERQALVGDPSTHAAGMEATVHPVAMGERRGVCVVVHTTAHRADTYALFHRLHAITSERRMTLEQRLDALFRLGSEHLGLPRVVQSRIEGRHYVVERCLDPTGHVKPGDDVELMGTFCDQTLRSTHPTAIHHAAESELAHEPCYLGSPIEAYLGAPVVVDAVKYGTLAFSQDRPRGPFTPEDLLVVRLLAQWVGHELARDRDLTLYQRTQDELDRLARTDALTRLPNRRAVGEALHWQVAYVRRSGMPLTVILGDLDRFKSINDRYGHDGGDAVLRAFAEVCRSQKRETDVCGRWGGEEFLFLLPNTDAAGGRVFAERLLQVVRDLVIPLPGGVQLSTTISLGAATVWSTETDDAVVGRADAALYRAKAQGRNRVVVDDARTPVPPQQRGVPKPA